MFSYVIRRLLYMVPITFCVMVITFILFFGLVNVETMARTQLPPRAPKAAIENWLHQHQFDKPLYLNVPGVERYHAGQPFYDSLFFKNIHDLATFNFGDSLATNRRHRLHVQGRRRTVADGYAARLCPRAYSCGEFLAFPRLCARVEARRRGHHLLCDAHEYPGDRLCDYLSVAARQCPSLLPGLRLQHARAGCSALPCATDRGPHPQRAWLRYPALSRDLSGGSACRLRAHRRREGAQPAGCLI
ncbi:MAG: hypothetical protein QM796_11910 [Chthoniobacteraceae bacterium]